MINNWKSLNLIELFFLSLSLQLLYGNKVINNKFYFFISPFFLRWVHIKSNYRNFERDAIPRPWRWPNADNGLSFNAYVGENENQYRQKCVVVFDGAMFGVTRSMLQTSLCYSIIPIHCVATSSSSVLSSPSPSSYMLYTVFAYLLAWLPHIQFDCLHFGIHT